MTTQVLRLPGGHEIPCRDGETPSAAFARHTAMALAEGFCPYHLSQLRPVPVDPASGVMVGGHCTPCGRFWSLGGGPDRIWAWHADHNPHTGMPLVPAWVDR